MTTPPFTDDDVERILRDFFAREMPPELQALPERPTATPSASQPAARRPAGLRHLRTALATLALAACGILIAVILISHSTPPRPDVTAVSGDSRPASDDPAIASHPTDGPSSGDTPAAEADDEPLIIVDDAASSDRRPDSTHRGPVEARSDRRWTNLDDRGGRTDFSVPNEITVEILPLDGEPVEPQTAPRGPDDPRLPEER